jgi:hyaluronoglucosaminidase
MLRFEGQHAMNVYYYAPKDDPYHRTLWRDAYPPAEMKRLGELVETAHRNFVDFCFAISPGLSMTYSSDQDFGVLTQKLQSVGKLGVSCFALFLDDVPQDLQSPQDQAQFKTLAQAHVFLINKLYRHLKSQSASNRLTVTPTTYTNAWGSRDYIKELGAGVDPGVAIVWTGPDVASPSITVAQASEWGGYLHRKPLVWDNFPVNDGRPWRVHLGPMRGRAANLPTVIQGLFSNPMNQARASLLPLQTVADY